MSVYREITASGKLFLIAGPCVIESAETCLEIAASVKALCNRLDIPYIFKSSFRKANRSRADAFTGIGDGPAREVLRQVRDQLDVPVLTDVHECRDVDFIADTADILQIPAFLCRQTDLLIAAGRSGRAVNIKKGQFMSGRSMGFAVEKVSGTGNDEILLTERGNSFGYHDLVVDLRNIPDMQSFGKPVVLDASHAVQRPNAATGVSGGLPEYIGMLARAGVAAGADGLFLETHPNPASAASDGSNMLPLDALPDLLEQVIAIKRALSSP